MLNHIQCRAACYEAERQLKLMKDGNPFALAPLAMKASIAAAEAAYLSDRCETQIAQRLHVAMDLMGEFLSPEEC